MIFDASCRGARLCAPTLCMVRARQYHAPTVRKPIFGSFFSGNRLTTFQEYNKWNARHSIKERWRFTALYKSIQWLRSLYLLTSFEHIPRMAEVFKFPSVYNLFFIFTFFRNCCISTFIFTNAQSPFWIWSQTFSKGILVIPSHLNHPSYLNLSERLLI